MGVYFVDSKNIGGYEIFVSAGTWRCSGYASHCRSREPFLRLNAASRRLKKTAVRKLHTAVMAGMAGFEPADDGVKVRCLTPWLHPNILFYAFYADTKIRKAFALRMESSNGVGNRVRTDDLQGHNLAL